MSHYAAALSRGGVRGSQQMLSIAKQFGEGSRDRGSVAIFLADSVDLLGFLSLLCISGCIRASVLGYLCCFQDCYLRRASGLWCY